MVNAITKGMHASERIGMTTNKESSMSSFGFKGFAEAEQIIYTM